jgi:hypothetical protein
VLRFLFGRFSLTTGENSNRQSTTGSVGNVTAL